MSETKLSTEAKLAMLKAEGVDVSGTMLEIGSLYVKTGYIDQCGDEEFNKILEDYREEIKPQE